MKSPVKKAAKKSTKSCQLKFKTFRIADVSTIHITQSDAALLQDETTPGRIAELDKIHSDDTGGPGFILSVPSDAVSHQENISEYLKRGFSLSFVGLIRTLWGQSIPYVRFDRDGEEVAGARIFNW